MKLTQRRKDAEKLFFSKTFARFASLREAF